MSVELVALAAACLGLIMIGADPFRFDGSEGVAGAVISLVAIGIHLGLVLLTVMKGKYRTALLGTFIPGLAMVAASRLARPGSRWARRHYDEAKVDRARTRAEHFDARWEPIGRHVTDFLGGRPAEEVGDHGGDQ